MTELCPRSCCWLTAAGVFILIGAVQFTAGLVLLKSKYVFLLSGPDFWTAVGNIITGSLLGIAASVWKKPRKRVFSRHVARENVVLALLCSSVILNATTTAILILGEGNAMLAIDVETRLEKNYTLGKEILRIAYATSVVCPVVCLVVAATAVVEGCCGMKSKINKTSLLESPKQQKKSVLNETPKRFDWVFDPEQNVTGNSTRKNRQRTPSPPSTASNDTVGASSMDLSSPLSKYPVQSTPTLEELQNSLAQMYHSRISGNPVEDSMDQTMSPPPSLAGEVIPIHVRTESECHCHAIPVEQPLTRGASTMQKLGESTVDCAPTRVRVTIPENTASRLKKTRFSSFRGGLERSSPTKKNHKRCHSPAMESIMEVSSSGDVTNLGSSTSVTSGYASSADVTTSAPKEAVETTPKQIVVPVEMVTPRKEATETIPKELYGKTRSMSMSTLSTSKYKGVEILDAYSLVGLNNLEIIATQYRNHAVLRYLQRKVSGN